MKTIQFPLEVRLHLSKFIAPGGFYEIKPTKSTKKFLISQTGRNFENRNSLLPGPGLSLIILYIINKEPMNHQNICRKEEKSQEANVILPLHLSTDQEWDPTILFPRKINRSSIHSQGQD